MTVANFVAQAKDLHPLSGSDARLRDAVELRFNQLAALLLLLLLSPLLLIVSFLIWQRDGPPIFFAHYRVGRDGKLFPCLKFRSMLRESEKALADHLAAHPAARAEWERDQKLTNDPRITPIGNFLRKSSLDELPQLLNVLRGEMNLVGPRPVTVPELSRYGRVRWHYLSVRPGITGLWQVSGRNNTTYEERVELDRRYVAQRSLFGDVGILFKTVRVVLLKEGAR
ncbi:MAG TPA: sugar transferase [Burkholderiaceae bacterium]|jgi:lipopolysaccharide/colanic/teichoic acid biosynthesis glycosyltransferase